MEESKKVDLDIQSLYDGMDCGSFLYGDFGRDTCECEEGYSACILGDLGGV